MNTFNQYYYFYSAWGDAVFLGLQTITIACLVLVHTQGVTTASSFVAMYMAVIAAVIGGFAPLNVLWFGQAINIPVILLSKVISINSILILIR